MATYTSLPPANLPGNYEGGPPSQDYYQRAVYRSPPRCFEAVTLPPTKFGRSQYFGLRIYPIVGETVSAVSGSTTSEHDIWRRWDDCLWFQDVLEHRYVDISREKRQRLQAGKGVKKNGMYLQDHAASFESLPPGPHPKSVAKDVHHYLPKLTKRGTFFPATQATVNQRHKEFSALIAAFFQENVPSLIEQLREDRIIRDFFGYWRLDHDLAAKKNGPRSKMPPNRGLSSASLSTSKDSLSPVSPFPLSTPRSASSHRRPHTADSTGSSSSGVATFSYSTVNLPVPASSSAPARLGTTFRDGTAFEDERHTHKRTSPASSSGSYPASLSSRATLYSRSSSSLVSSRRRTDSHRPKPSPPASARTFNVASDFPLFLSSSTRDVLPPSRPSRSPTYSTPRLGPLPEDTELSVSITPPTPRSPKDSCVNPDRVNRSCVVWPDTDEVSSSEGDVLEQELLTPVDGAVFNVAIAKSTSSSLPQRSTGGSNNSRINVDFPLTTSTDSLSNLEYLNSPMMTSSGSILGRSRSDRRQRSLSQPLPLTAPVPSDIGEEDWSADEEDFIETYFGGPKPFFTPNEEDPLAFNDSNPSDVSLDVPYDPPDSPSVVGFPTPRQKVAYLGGPPGAFHHPWMTASPSPPPSMSSAEITISPSITGQGKPLVVKAMLDDTNVVFRIQRDVSLWELHQHLHEEFACTEGAVLRDTSLLMYVPPATGGKRVSTISSMSANVDWARALPLQTEEEWAAAVASCGSKITLRLNYPTPPPTLQ
ncbi:hypothetical protein BJV74DRAFT_890826 [Russula compacta]|nr:hypothetical protein BJV74DRAFT_890826 [Russula compacta]